MERLTRKSNTSDMVWFIDREHKNGYAEREPCEMDAHHARLAIEKLAEYEGLEERGQILIVPQIKKNKTLYWIWGDEIMPVLFKRITSCVVDDGGNLHVMCEMTTKKDRTFVHTYRRKNTEHTFKAGDKRYFYSEDIGRTVFFTREEAKTVLKELRTVKG